MTAHEIASIISIFLTFPTITTALAVMVRWWNRARFLLLRRSKNMSAVDWFVRGVFKGFLKDFFDNGYWLIPWTLVLINSPHAGAWMMGGVYVNCLIRQSLGIMAARCHLHASEQYSRKIGNPNYLWTFKFSFLIGCLLGLIYVFLILSNG